MSIETDEQKRIRINQLWQEKFDADPWNGWRALLNGWEIDGVKATPNPNTPFQGYYRSKKMDKTFEPVAFFKEDGGWVCLRPKRDSRYQIVTEKDEDWLHVMDAWPHISGHPIAHSLYKAVAEEGKPWPDADERLTSEALAKSAEPAPATKPAVIGGNNPPAETPMEALKNKIDNAKGGVSDYAKLDGDKVVSLIKDAAALAKAKSLKNRLTELSGEVKTERMTLKRPFMDEIEKVDTVWMPLEKDAAANAKLINTAMDVFATEQLLAQRAEEKRIKEELAAAERIRIANEAKTQQAEATGTTAELEAVPEVKPTKAAPVADTTVRAGYGRAGHVQTEVYAEAIVDIDALFGFLKTHKELRDKMLELADRGIKAGYAVPGVKKNERAKVKG